jgi:cytochrome c oxidase subunit 2
MNPETYHPHIDIDSLWLPKQGSTIAPDVDWAWDMVMIVSIAFFMLLMGLMVYFAIAYRRRHDREITSDIDNSHVLERIWTIVPLILVGWLFFVGFKGFVNASVAPADSYQIHVQARKWVWEFTYPNGVTTSELIVPEKTPIKLIMSSSDVVHSFYVPEFRVKRDVIPGLYTTMWFEPTEPLDSVIQCAEYCGGAGDGSRGTGHSGMWAPVRVVTSGQFKAWLDAEDEKSNKLPPAALGKKLYADKGCNGCHTLDGKPLTGPTFKGVFGRKEQMSSGETITVDENYLRESILNSQAKIVQGFQPVMPVFQGQLNEKQVTGLIEFIKEQK